MNTTDKAILSSSYSSKLAIVQNISHISLWWIVVKYTRELQHHGTDAGTHEGGGQGKRNPGSSQQQPAGGFGSVAEAHQGGGQDKRISRP